MIKKYVLLFSCLLFVHNYCFAKDIIQFDFPNNGWHKVQSPDKVESKKCYVPFGQESENFTEMLIFFERILQNQDIGAMTILQKQLGKDKNNFPDIVPQYIKQDMNDAMAAWCSKQKNTCTIERAFQGKEGVILAIYINKMPHYSQNMFGQWSNILNAIELYDSNNNKLAIEL